MTSPTLAERLLLDLGIDRPGNIDLEAIAADQGVYVRFREMDGCEARIVGDDRRAIVSVNSRSRPTRQRFSLAHELGHWQHHRGRCLFCDATQIGNPGSRELDPERQADDFASDLVLPMFMLRPMLSKLGKVTVERAGSLAQAFDVSLTATLLKIVSSGRFPMMLVCHGRSKRLWFKRTDKIQRWWFPREDLDRESFAYEMLFNDATGESSPRRMPAEAWFSFNDCDKHEVLEQSIRLPNDRLLTILTLPDAAMG